MRSPSESACLPKGWRIARFDELFKRIERKILIDDTETYNCVGVRWYGMGAFIREELSGINISRKQQWVIRAGNVVYNKLFAWKGAFAIADNSIDGCIVSDKFPTYEANLTLVLPEYLRYYFRTSQLAYQAEALSKGAAAISKLTLNPPQFWGLTVPLPPLEEQRHIVARIEELAGKVEEAQRLRRKAAEEVDASVASLHVHLSYGRSVRLDEVLVLDEQREDVKFGKTYPQVGVRGFGQGLFTRETLEESDTTYKAFNRLYEGAIVLSQVKGWEGAIAGCHDELAGKYVSPEYRTFRCIPGKALPAYLAGIVVTPWFWTRLATATRGVGGRRERTRPEQFLQLAIPMPSVEQQEQALPVLARLAALKRLQHETVAALDALLPSILDKAFKGEL